MRDRWLLPAVILLAGSTAWAASPLREAARRLDGDWQGGQQRLRIDSDRDQASTDPSKPFEWRRFLVKEVTDEAIVFTVGAEMFEAKLDADRLVLTGTSFRGERRLRRIAPQPVIEMTLRGALEE